jgi:hypothetical protein
MSLERCGHFASLEQPDKVAELIATTIGARESQP